MRIPTYPESSGDKYGPNKPNGEELVVVGLLGFESLNTSINAKTKGANSLAREAADAEYLAKK